MDSDHNKNSHPITESPLGKVALDYIHQPLLKNVDKSKIIFNDSIGVADDKNLQILLDNSNNQLRMYGTAEELAENLKVYQNFPLKHKKFGLESMNEDIERIQFRSLKNEVFYCKQYYLSCLRSALFEVYRCAKVNPPPEVLEFIKKQGKRLDGSYELSRHDNRSFERIIDNINFLLTTENKIENEETPQWTVYKSDTVIDRLQKFISTHRHIFLPYSEANNENKPIAVRIFEDGSEKFVMTSELFKSKKIRDSIGEVSTWADKEGTLCLMNLTDVFKIFRNHLEDIEFIRIPIVRAKHAAVPIVTPTGDHCILIADVLLELLRRLISALKIFQKIEDEDWNTLTEYMKLLEPNFPSVIKHNFFVNLSIVEKLKKITDGFWQSFENVPAKSVRDIGKDGFTVDDLKDELKYLGLTDVFPEIAGCAEDVYEEVNQRKNKKFLRTCDMFDALEMCQLICIFGQFPNLKNFLVTQKSCHQVSHLHGNKMLGKSLNDDTTNTQVNKKQTNLNTTNKAKMNNSSFEFPEQTSNLANLLSKDTPNKLTTSEAQVTLKGSDELKATTSESSNVINAKLLSQAMDTREVIYPELQTSLKISSDSERPNSELIGRSYSILSEVIHETNSVKRILETMNNSIKEYYPVNGNTETFLPKEYFRTAQVSKKETYSSNTIGRETTNSYSLLEPSTISKQTPNLANLLSKDTPNKLTISETHVALKGSYELKATTSELTENSVKVVMEKPVTKPILTDNRPREYYHCDGNTKTLINFEKQTKEKRPIGLDPDVASMFLSTIDKVYKSGVNLMEYNSIMLSGKNLVNIGKIDKESESNHVLKELPTVKNLKDDLKKNGYTSKYTVVKNQSAPNESSSKIQVPIKKKINELVIENPKPANTASNKLYGLLEEIEIEKKEESNTKVETIMPIKPSNESKCCSKCLRTSERCNDAQRELKTTQNKLKMFEKKARDYDKLEKKLKEKEKENEQLKTINSKSAEELEILKLKISKTDEIEEKLKLDLKKTKNELKASEKETKRIEKEFDEYKKNEEIHRNEREKMFEKMEKRVIELTESSSIQSMQLEECQRNHQIMMNSVRVESNKKEEKLIEQIQQLEAEIIRLKEEYGRDNEKQNLENEISDKDTLINELKSTNSHLCLQVEEHEKTIQILLDRLSSTLSTISNRLGTSSSPKRDTENTSEMRFQLVTLQKIKDTIRNGSALKHAKEMVEKLISITNRPEIQQFANYEFALFEGKIRNYLQAVELNIQKLKRTGDCIYIPPLPDHLSLSDHFIEEYRSEIGEKPSTSSETPSELADSECLICLANMENSDETIKCENCRRRFHSECASEWLKRKSVCPACSRGLLDPTEFPTLG